MQSLWISGLTFDARAEIEFKLNNAVMPHVKIALICMLVIGLRGLRLLPCEYISAVFASAHLRRVGHSFVRFWSPSAPTPLGESVEAQLKLGRCDVAPIDPVTLRPVMQG